MTENLPAEVIQTDRRLQRSADQLMELRWHWTIDESNAGRVSVAEYARQVGVARPRISQDAHSWSDWLAAQRKRTADGTAPSPGEPQTPDDYRQLKRLGEERGEAAKAIARTTGVPVGTVANHKRDEVDAVLSTARERAVDRGTTVEHEIERAAEWRAKARKAADREQDERRKAHTLRFIGIEGDIGVIMQRLRKVLDSAQDVPFTDEERELITESLAKMRALLGLIDLRITGETRVDWDAELKKLEA
jgi:nucleotide-binding universal stress UspA family protein